MTNAEAIQTLKLMQAQVEWDYPMDYAAAIDLAIEALEAQDVPDTNVGDMISRQAAISIPLTPKKLRKYQTCNLDDAYTKISDRR